MRARIVSDIVYGRKLTDSFPDSIPITEIQSISRTNYRGCLWNAGRNHTIIEIVVFSFWKFSERLSRL